MTLDGRCVIYHGDNRHVLPLMPANFVHAVVTDPPYELTTISKRYGTQNAVPTRNPTYARMTAGFMGKRWDGTGIAFDPEFWAEVLRVLRPGGHLLAFGGTRTYHRMACAVEDAGFEVRDCLLWLHGHGFPKSLNVSTAVDKRLGADRQDLYEDKPPFTEGHAETVSELIERRPVTEEAHRWAGWGTALKPACEPIIVARKPLEGTVAANVLAWEAGGINIGACRVGPDGGTAGAGRGGPSAGPLGDGRLNGPRAVPVPGLGRWPANVLLDEEAAAALDAVSPESTSPDPGVPLRSSGREGYGFRGKPRIVATYGFGDRGGASRFFYTSKATSAERADGLGRRTSHPTVKPLDLMAWLVTLVTPPGGVVLDPFLGSGTTAMAAVGCGFDWIGVEKEAEYIPDARDRIGLGARIVEVPGPEEADLVFPRDSAPDHRESRGQESGVAASAAEPPAATAEDVTVPVTDPGESPPTLTGGPAGDLGGGGDTPVGAVPASTSSTGSGEATPAAEPDPPGLPPGFRTRPPRIPGGRKRSPGFGG